MEVFVPPYYLKHDQPYLSMYVECIHEGQKMRGKVVDCVPFLKYEIEYVTQDTKNKTIINQNQIFCNERPESEMKMIDIEDEVMVTLKRGEEFITGVVQKIFDHSYYTVEFKNYNGTATFTRDKLNEITYKDYFKLCRPQEEEELEPSTPDGKESVDSDFVPGEASESSDDASDTSDSDAHRVSESELKDISLEEK